MNKLWVFGDNNSAVFGKTKERRFKYYKEYRNGVFPKTWSELLSKELGLELKNMAVSGQSNHNDIIFFYLLRTSTKHIKYIIIGLTRNCHIF